MKICTKCGIAKDATTENFHSHKGQSSGLRPDCKECFQKVRRVRYEAKRDELYKQSRNYMLSHPHRGAYISWTAMKQRCLCETSSDYLRYGGRGIAVCDEWVGFESFLADMGERPEGMTLDRVDNNGNYEPSNCRWATPKQQSANRRNSRAA